MTEILPFLKDLISAAGLPGYEDPAAKIIAAKWQPLVDELSRSKLGSLHGLHRGTGPLTSQKAGKEPRPSIMIATHMDSIGLMVTGILNGFLRFTQVGGVDVRILPGTAVSVFATGKNASGTGATGKNASGTGATGKNASGTGSPDDSPNTGLPLPGVVVQPSTHLLPEGERDGPVPLANLFIDTGLLPGKVAGMVRIGDLVAFAQPPVELSGDMLSGHSLDNRASVVAICLEELQSRPHYWDVWAVASSQEEVGAMGAAGSAYELHPRLAIVVDVTYAKGPGTSEWSAFTLGKGPTIVMGANMHPALHKAMKELADKLEIPYGLEYSPTQSGTDGMATQVAAEGIPTLVMGIPLRYMHTPVEVVAIKDIQRAGRLLAEFISGLGPNFMEQVVWDK
jgi:tetrahedral aminopeptidase